MLLWVEVYNRENYQYRVIKNIMYYYYIGWSYGENVLSCLTPDMELFLKYCKIFKKLLYLFNKYNVIKYINDNEIEKDLANINKKFIIDIITNSRYDKFIKLWMEFYKKFWVEPFLNDVFISSPLGINHLLWVSLCNDIQDKIILHNNFKFEYYINWKYLNWFIRVPLYKKDFDIYKKIVDEYEEKVFSSKDDYFDLLEAEEEQKELKKRKIDFFRSNICNIISKYNSAFFLIKDEYKDYDKKFKNEEISISKMDIIMEELEILLNDMKNLEKIVYDFILIDLDLNLNQQMIEHISGEWVYVEYDYYGAKLGSIEKKIKN